MCGITNGREATTWALAAHMAAAEGSSGAHKGDGTDPCCLGGIGMMGGNTGGHYNETFGGHYQEARAVELRFMLFLQQQRTLLLHKRSSNSNSIEGSSINRNQRNRGWQQQQIKTKSKTQSTSPLQQVWEEGWITQQSSNVARDVL